MGIRAIYQDLVSRFQRSFDIPPEMIKFGRSYFKLVCRRACVRLREFYLFQTKPSKSFLVTTFLFKDTNCLKIFINIVMLQ